MSPWWSQHLTYRYRKWRHILKKYKKHVSKNIVYCTYFPSHHFGYLFKGFSGISQLDSSADQVFSRRLLMKILQPWLWKRWNIRSGTGNTCRKFCWRVASVRFLSLISWVSELNLVKKESVFTRWWFQTFFIFTPSWGRFPIWPHIFQMGWNHQPDSIG